MLFPTRWSKFELELTEVNLKSDWVLTETVGNGCEFVIKRTYDPALLILFYFSIYSSVLIVRCQ